MNENDKLLAEKLCECGCGEALKPDSVGRIHHYIFGHQARTYRPRVASGGYLLIWMPEHPRAIHKGRVYEHIVVAEKALGRHLPPDAEVHHVDENTANNANSNLVICENQKYHAMLHRRMRVLRYGGDPNTQQICCTCQKPKCFDQFYKCQSQRYPNGRVYVCKACQSAATRGIYERRKTKAAIYAAALKLAKEQTK